MTATGLRAIGALLPLLGLVAFLLATMAIFGVRCATVGRPRTAYLEARNASALWTWWMEWWVWLWGPVERACIALRISPDAITASSTALSLVAATLLAQGRLSWGGWTYLLAASLDVVDGRVARAQGTSSAAGAFLDSTLDRVAELAVFAGLTVHFRSDPALYAALAAGGASLVVSYARARGESLGVGAEARTGSMQRAERVVLTGVPCALSPLVDAWYGGGAGEVLVGSALALLAVVTTVTAARRSYAIWTSLRARVALEAPIANLRSLGAPRRRGPVGP